MSGDRSFLQSLCARGAGVSIDAPFNAAWLGERWDAATNGHALLLLRGATVPERNESPPLGEIERMVSSPSKKFTVQFRELLTWSTVSGPLWEQCPECGGTGKVYCDSCDRDGANCGCHDGRVFCSTHGVIGGVAMNRRLLGAYLQHVTADTVVLSLGGKGDPIHVNGGDWHVLMMPIRGEASEDAEVFVLSEAAQ